MLISHIYKFIYLKPKKVAGTSTEVFLKKYCINPNKISLFENQLQHNKNKISFKFPTESQYGIITNGIGEDTNNSPLITHATCEDIIKEVGNDIWDNYIKITNIRNPWDLAVSMFHWKSKLNNSNTNFDDFINQSWVQGDLRGNKKIWSYQGQFDFEYIRFENLEEDILKVCEKLNIPVTNINLGHYKKMDRKPYQEYYDEKTKKIIEAVYKKEIEFFNYKF